MKKLGRFLMSLAVIGGAAAGAYAVYKKYFAPEDNDDFDDDFDEDFEDDAEEESGESAKREYVSLNPTSADTEDDGISAEAIAEKEVAMAEGETVKAKDAAEE